MADRPSVTDIADPATLFRLDGKVALVTGAGSGIGALAARVLARAGATAIATDRDPATARATADAIRAEGLAAASYALDVSDEASVVAAFRSVEAEHGPVGVLINNAGIARRGATEDLERTVWDEVVSVNMTGVFLCAREAGRQMLGAGGGSIVNISSMWGHVGGGFAPNLSYHATKGAVVMMTKALAVEWGGRGVRVNDIAPTFLKTNLTTHLFADPDLIRRFDELTPLGRTGVPNDLAGALLFLASPASAYVTGHSLLVDGGWTAR